MITSPQTLLLPAMYSASASRNDSSDSERTETFQKFFECWLTEQDQHLRDLISTSKDYQNGTATKSQTSSLIDRVIHHYERYYVAKSTSAKQDVLSILTPSWRSTLEDAFLWIGGWRPSMAFHLLYSKSGLQVQDQLADLIRGLSTGDLADLSHTQLARVDELQLRTIREEREITEKMAKLQQTVANSSMVELSHAATESIQNGGDFGEHGVARVEEAIGHKEKRLEEMLERADGLRLRTLKAVVDILAPIQTVHFLIAAAELHLRIHDWGKKIDDRQHHQTGRSAPTRSLIQTS